MNRGDIYLVSLDPTSGNELIICTSTTCYGLVGAFDARIAAVSASVSALNVQVADVSAKLSVVATSVSAINTQLAAVSALVSSLSALDIRVIE